MGSCEANLLHPSQTSWRVSACRVAASAIHHPVFEIGQVITQCLSLLALNIEGKILLQDINKCYSDSAFSTTGKNSDRGVKYHGTIFHL